jgi:hypothetical protein
MQRNEKAKKMPRKLEKAIKANDVAIVNHFLPIKNSLNPVVQPSAPPLESFAASVEEPPQCYKAAALFVVKMNAVLTRAPI